MSIINEDKVRARLEQLAGSKGSSSAVNCQYLLQPNDRLEPVSFCGCEIAGRLPTDIHPLSRRAHFRYCDVLAGARAVTSARPARVPVCAEALRARMETVEEWAGSVGWTAQGDGVRWRACQGLGGPRGGGAKSSAHLAPTGACRTADLAGRRQEAVDAL